MSKVKQEVINIYAGVVEALQALIINKARSASKYVSPGGVVKVTRKHPCDLRARSETFFLTVGKPNFLGRRFVKACVKAGEKFPVKKVQLKFFPVAKRKVTKKHA